MARMSRLSSLLPERLRASRTRAIVLVTLGVLLLVGTMVGVLVTSGGEDEDDEASGQGAGTGEAQEAAEPVAYLDVPEGVELTELGAELALGEGATVAWRAGVETIGVVELRVDALQPAPQDAFAGWLVGGTGLQAAPYFVTVTITNVGEIDLAGLSLPLYLERQDGRLVPASRFGAEFPACASTALPQPFGPDETQATCQVYLSEGGLEVAGLVFLPFDGADTVRWDPTLPPVTPTDPASPTDPAEAPSSP